MGIKFKKRVRWVPAGKSKAKGWKKTGRKRKQKKQLINDISLKMGSQVWPPEYRTTMTTYCTSILSPGTGVAQFSYLGNSFGDGTGAGNGVGPAQSGSGSFAKNYPAGLKGLIQTPAAAGTAICPYTMYRIIRSRIFYRVIPAAIGGSTAPSSEIRVICFPSTQFNYSGTSFSQMVEQQNARFDAYSPGYFGTSTTTAITGGGQPLANTGHGFKTNTMSTAKIFGLPSNVVNEDNTYWANTGTALTPTNLWYWQLVMAGDGTNSWAADVEVIVKHDCVFFQRNYNLTSAQNN